MYKLISTQSLSINAHYVEFSKGKHANCVGYSLAYIYEKLKATTCPISVEDLQNFHNKNYKKNNNLSKKASETLELDEVTLLDLKEFKQKNTSKELKLIFETITSNEKNYFILHLNFFNTKYNNYSTHAISFSKKESNWEFYDSKTTNPFISHNFIESMKEILNLYEMHNRIFLNFIKLNAYSKANENPTYTV